MTTPSPEALKRYNETVEKAEARYRKIREKLDAEYQSFVAPAREKFFAVRKKAEAVYNRACSPARLKYEKTVEPLQTLLAQTRKAAEDVRQQKIRAASRQKTKERKAAMEKLYKQEHAKSAYARHSR